SYRQLADTVERVTQQTFSKAVHTLPALLEQLRTDPDDAMLRYNSKLPIVVYTPSNVDVKYRIWRADETIGNAVVR
ncbi:hypothetical protein JTM01_38630, partial [Pseudomonas aeruginosa]|nr:hypothetical protein [Pseudomonas aeruginosa]